MPTPTAEPTRWTRGLVFALILATLLGIGFYVFAWFGWAPPVFGPG